MDRTTAAFRSAATLARTLPRPVGEGLAKVGGMAATVVAPGRRAQVERNLRRVYGDDFSGVPLWRAVAATFDSYAAYWIESFRLPGTSPDALAAGMTCDGLEHLYGGREAGRGAILALPHLGGWEWAGFWVATVLDMPITVVVEPLEPRELFEWFVGLRESFGMNVVPLGHDAGAAVIAALKANHVVCLLCDRDIGGSGIAVDFFGERTTLPGGPATLALRTGAPLIATAVYFEGPGHRRHHGVLRSPVDVSRAGRLRDDVNRVTQELAHELEALIRAAPEQWHLMQPNWPSDPGYRSAGTEVP